jgi:hypothetical protein
MPVATSSRRKARRNADEIEDAEPSQPMVQDEPMDEEEDEAPAPRRGAKAVKKEAAATKKAPRATEDNDDEEEEMDAEEMEDNDPPIDVSNFPDYPIEKKDSSKLLSVARDWEQIKNIHSNYYSVLKDVAAAAAEMNDQGESQKVSSRLDAVAPIDPIDP